MEVGQSGGSECECQGPCECAYVAFSVKAMLISMMRPRQSCQEEMPSPGHCCAKPCIKEGIAKKENLSKPTTYQCDR